MCKLKFTIITIMYYFTSLYRLNCFASFHYKINWLFSKCSYSTELASNKQKKKDAEHRIRQHLNVYLSKHSSKISWTCLVLLFPRDNSFYWKDFPVIPIFVNDIDLPFVFTQKDILLYGTIRFTIGSPIYLLGMTHDMHGEPFIFDYYYLYHHSSHHRHICRRLHQRMILISW